MPKPKREVHAALLRKGFREKTGKHDFFIYWNLDGTKSAVQTMTSHSHTEISDGNLSLMARQCRLTKPQFLDLINCPLSREAYDAILHA